MTSKEKQNENLYEWISGILGQISNGYPLQRSGSQQKEFWKTVLTIDALYKGHQITKISRRKSKLENPI
jgi:hypothetical protein